MGSRFTRGQRKEIADRFKAVSSLYPEYLQVRKFKTYTNSYLYFPRTGHEAEKYLLMFEGKTGEISFMAGNYPGFYMPYECNIAPKKVLKILDDFLRYMEP